MALQRTCEIPDFPFQNRHEETNDVREFCSDQTNLSVLLIVAESGVGKSRFMRYISNHPCTGGWESIHIAPLDLTGTRFDLMGGINNQIQKVISLKNSGEVYTLTLHKLEKLYRSFPRLLSSSAKLIPGGTVVAEGVDQLSKSAFDSDVARSRYTAIVEMAQVTREIAKRQRLLFLFDDLHEFSNLELGELALFLSELSLTSLQKNIRLVISTQPISSINLDYGSWIENINRSGMLAELSFPNLTDCELKEIAAKTIENPIEAESLISRSTGNPQKLVEQLLKLNSAGELKSKNNLLLLPKNTASNKALSKTLWDNISGTGLRRRLLGVIALSSTLITLSDIVICSESLGFSSEIDLQSLSSDLEKENILRWSTFSENNQDYTLNYHHDFMRTQARSAILNGNCGERLEFSTIVLRIVYKKLNQHLDDPDLFLKKSSNLNLEIDAGHSDFIDLFSDYCDALGMLSRPEYLPCSLGLIRLAFASGRYDIVALTGNYIINKIKNTIDQKSPEYKIYLEKIVDSKYRAGLFREVIEIGSDLPHFSSAIDYFVGASMLVLKNEEGLSKKLVCFSASAAKSCADSEWQLRLDLLYALALQETGELEKAIDYYNSSFANCSVDTKNGPAWIMLNVASTLFQNRDEALINTKKAVELAEESSDYRLHGLALNNLGICNLDVGNLASAKSNFEDSERILKKCAGHESIFPMNNLAGVDLVLGNFEKSRRRLHNALFRSTSDNYTTTLRINLALANFNSGNGFDEKRFKLDTGKSDISDHTFLQWLINYARVYITAKSLRNDEIRDFVTREREHMGTHFSNIELSALYWNRLVDSLGEENSLKLPESNTGNISGIDIQECLMRPAFMAFGRI